MKLTSKFLVSLVLLSLTTVPALAQAGQYYTPPAVSVQTAPSPSPSGLKTPNPGKLRSCQAKETNIKTRMENLTRLANNMLNVFSSIAQRVETFYLSKVIPSGKTVTNYDALVTDTQTKAAGVATALGKAQTDANNFSCESGNPKAGVTLFRQDMQAVKTALKNYRTSIKNLIVAVRGAAVKAQGTTSPTPTASPTATP